MYFFKSLNLICAYIFCTEKSSNIETFFKDFFVLKWYQSQTLNNVSVFLLFLKEGRHETMCSKDAGPKEGGFGRGPTSMGE